MDVNVDQARCDDPPCAVDSIDLRAISKCFGIADLAIDNQEIADFVAPIRRIDDPAVLQVSDTHFR
jgi:hypothetical protein